MRDFLRRVLDAGYYVSKRDRNIGARLPDVASDLYAIFNLWRATRLHGLRRLVRLRSYLPGESVLLHSRAARQEGKLCCWARVHTVAQHIPSPASMFG
jgi:hypothetical protein